MNDSYWPFRGPRSFLFLSSSQPELALEATQQWTEGPPDLCVASPSSAARRTATIACAGGYVQLIEEPELRARGPRESDADFAARRAKALRLLHAFETQAMLVVSDDLFAALGTPFVADADSILQRAAAIERALPLP